MKARFIILKLVVILLGVTAATAQNRSQREYPDGWKLVNRIPAYSHFDGSTFNVNLITRINPGSGQREYSVDYGDIMFIAIVERNPGDCYDSGCWCRRYTHRFKVGGIHYFFNLADVTSRRRRVR